jgi:hypothetical protein
MAVSRPSRIQRTVATLSAACIVAACQSSAVHGPRAVMPSDSSAQRLLSTNAAGKGRLGKVLTSGDGTQIFGFDVAQDDESGILATSTHIETFDQSTGAITGSFPKITPPRTTYGMDGIFPGDVALITKYVEPKGSIYAKRFYGTIGPFTAKKFTGSWTPPMHDVDVQQAGGDLMGTTSVLFAIELQNDDVPDLFVSDVAKNTFDKTIHLDAGRFSLGDQPQLGSFIVGGKAVLATSPDGGAVGGSAPINEIVDLKTGSKTDFAGYNLGPFGAGFVNGMAVDPNTGVEATSTELNAQVEFYDVRKRTGIIAVQLPCTSDSDQSFSGAGIGVDTLHKLFIVADQAYGCDNGADGAAIVYDEKGDVVESIAGFKFFIGEGAPALNMKRRSGWFFGPGFDDLQQFFY